MNTTITLKYETDENEEIELQVPAKMEVCPECEGHGYVLREGLRGVAYTAEEFREAFCDDEDRQAYFSRGGKYDTLCDSCGGKNVVPVVDEDRIPENLKADYAAFQKYDEQMARYEAEDRATARMERLMGC
jgi:hypothetical protein